MKKTTKALYAGVAGLALLTTTGGTFAQWTDSAALPSAAVETGDLRLDLAEALSASEDPWTWVFQPADGAPQDWFPSAGVGANDTLIGTTYLATTIDGDTLAATLSGDFNWNPGTHPWFSEATYSVDVGSPGARTESEDSVKLTLTITFSGTALPEGSNSEMVGDGLVGVTLQQIVTGRAFGLGEGQ